MTDRWRLKRVEKSDRGVPTRLLRCQQPLERLLQAPCDRKVDIDTAGPLSTSFADLRVASPDAQIPGASPYHVYRRPTVLTENRLPVVSAASAVTQKLTHNAAVTQSHTCIDSPGAGVDDCMIRRHFEHQKLARLREGSQTVSADDDRVRSTFKVSSVSIEAGSKHPRDLLGTLGAVAESRL